MSYLKKTHISDQQFRKDPNSNGEIYTCPFCESNKITNKYKTANNQKLFCTVCLNIFIFKKENNLKFLEQ